MKLVPKIPEGLETANTRGGGLRWHSHLDVSCEIDREEIPYGASHFEGKLLEDMRTLSQLRLERLYPEMIFGFHDDAKEPKQRDYRVRVRNGWRWAQWRSTSRE